MIADDQPLSFRCVSLSWVSSHTEQCNSALKYSRKYELVCRSTADCVKLHVRAVCVEDRDDNNYCNCSFQCRDEFDCEPSFVCINGDCVAKSHLMAMWLPMVIPSVVLCVGSCMFLIWVIHTIKA